MSPITYETEYVMVQSPRHIQSLQPYIAGKPIDEVAREKGLTRIVKLASNENPLGASPRALEAASRSLKQGHRYVDPHAHELTHALAQHTGRKPEQIICGAGTDAMLGYIIGTFTEEDQEVLTSEGTFIGIYVNTFKQKRLLRQVPMIDYHYDLGGIRDAINDQTRIIYLANPNNPTGTIFNRTPFEEFMAAVPSHVLVILDEAYASYAGSDPKYPDGLQYDYPNLIVTRTFSKDYGLAGLRVGYATGHADLIAQLYKVKLPFEPSMPAQAAAKAALDDSEFLHETLVSNRRSLDRMVARFNELGLAWVPTHGNFLLLTLSNEPSAAAFTEACLDRGLIVRHVKPFGIPHGVRINSGTEDETTFALDVITQVKDSLPASSFNADH